MTQQVYITGIGDDRPGIVASLTDIFLRYDGNIVESTMTMLGNQFAFLLVVGLPDDANVEMFCNAFQPIEKEHRISIFVQPLEKDIHAASQRPDGNPFMISVAGEDKMGITAHFSKILANHQVNIMDLNAKTIDGNGGPTYILMIEVILPKTINIPSFEQDLVNKGEELNVEVTYHPLEQIEL